MRNEMSVRRSPDISDTGMLSSPNDRVPDQTGRAMGALQTGGGAVAARARSLDQTQRRGLVGQSRWSQRDATLPAPEYRNSGVMRTCAPRTVQLNARSMSCSGELVRVLA